MKTQIHEFCFETKLVLRTPTLPFKAAKYIDIFKAYEDPVFKEAVYIASKDVSTAASKVIPDKSKRDAAIEKTKDTLMKYHGRMTSRCTPFGLFSTCSEINWSDKFDPVIISNKNLKRYTNLDMAYLCSLMDKLAMVPEIAKSIKYSPNNTIYKVGSKLRYVQYYSEGLFRKHNISIVENDYPLSRILAKATNGQLYNDLLEVLLQEGFPYEDSEEYLNELIKEKLLISELNPILTEDDFLSRVIKIINQIPRSEPINKIEKVLINVSENLKLIDRYFGNEIFIYDEIIENLNKIFSTEKFTKLFQVDTYRNNVTGSLNVKIQHELYDAIKLLTMFSEAPAENNLKNFSIAFYERYGDNSIPLVEAVDNEIGLGYPLGEIANNTDLIHGIFRKTNRQQKNSFNKAQLFFIKKFFDAQKDNKTKIEIEESELDTFDTKVDQLPACSCIFFSYLLGRDDSYEIHLKGIGNSAGGNMISRFTKRNEIYDILSNINKHEAYFYNDRIVAEIVHVPAMTRMANILNRKNPRDYEIPYVTESGKQQDFQLNIRDLFLKIDQGKLKLFSKKHRKEIVPFLTSAHNYSNMTLPLYKLLCDLQNNGINHNISATLDPLRKLFDHFPRISYKNVILQPETWFFTEGKIDLFNDKSVLEWQNQYQIPSLIVLSEGDNELLINLESEQSRQIFINSIKNKRLTTIKESLFRNDDNFFVKNENGEGVTNELLTFMYKNKSKGTPSRDQMRIPMYNDIKKYDIGSEWLYYKLYCSSDISDKILMDAVQPIVEFLNKKKLIKSWFFIRYSDPEPHLRIRFKLNDITTLSETIQHINCHLKKQSKMKQIWRIQTETYMPEIQRYGKKTIQFIERIFETDSIFCLEILKRFGNQPDRWLYLVLVMDGLLNAFGFSLLEKKQFMKFTSEAFEREHHIDKMTQIILDKRYRKYKNDIFYILNEHKIKNTNFARISEKYLENVYPTIQKIKNTYSIDNLYLPKLCGDLLHMMNNRFFATNQRTHEFVLYRMLFKYYTSYDKIKSKETESIN